MENQTDRQNISVVQAFLAEGKIGSAYGEVREKYGILCSRVFKKEFEEKYHDRVDEAVHEGVLAFLKTLQNPSGNFDSDKFHGRYIAKFCVNVFNNILRKKRELPVDFDKPNGLTFPSSNLDKEVFSGESVELFLSSVREDCRTIFTLLLQGYALNEIAEKMNISKDATLRKRKHDCVKTYKDLWKKIVSQ